ncbi:ATP-dependent zinc protease family protein [Salinisphaera orenii]|uniref:ATP-dependent zinc protease family protein n=1 Tax=Salinisphaera orenii TaxID=856731 RepID=UPI000DBE6212
MSGVSHSDEDRCVGWREYIALPDLETGVMRAKFDTGARTSAIGVMGLTTRIGADGRRWAFFELRPRIKARVIQCSAPLVDERDVRDASGAESARLFIETRLVLGADCWSIELGLAQRETMRFPMLIGRRGMRGICVDPAGGYLRGPPDMRRVPEIQ